MRGSLRLINGRIFTGDSALGWQESLLIENGRITWVGGGSPPAPSGTPTVDLKGRLVVPGLTDAHVHFLWYARSLANVDLAGVASLTEALAMLRQRADSTEPGRWVVGTGYNHNVWGLPEEPDCVALDAVLPDHPVAVTSKCGHNVWANSVAMRVAGVDEHTPDPPGARIERYEDGRPRGLFREGAMSLIYSAIPPFSQQENQSLLKRAMQQVHALGLTGLHNCERSDELSALAALDADGELTVRVVQHYALENFDAALKLGLNSGFGGEMLSLGNLKLFLDGALGVQTALMEQPFCGSENMGIQTMAMDELEEMVLRAARHGIGSAVHAIGDRANRLALDVLLRAGEVNRSLRHRIEHAQLLNADLIDRFSRQKVVASVQPTHVLGDMDLVDRYWGVRGRYAYAFGSLRRAGVTLALGSDCPVESISPLLGIHAAVNRQRTEGYPEGGFYPSERLSVHDAVTGYTMGPAYAAGLERELGSLAPGKLGDLVVLDRDVFSIAPSEIHEVKPELTVVGGVICHEA